MGADELHQHVIARQEVVPHETNRHARFHRSRRDGRADVREPRRQIGAAGLRHRPAARDGTLSIMVSASAAALAAIRPFLACMGSEITHCGDVGSGQVVKILNNMVLFMTVNALAEALVIARSAGVDGKLLFDVMAKGSADSFAVRNQGKNALEPGVFPEDAFATDYALKDIRLALELAADGGVAVEAATLTCDLLARTSEAGFGRNYYPVMIKLIE